MAAPSNSLHNKIAKLLSRRHGKPVLKPNRPLVLANAVGNRKPRLGEASCITEMSLMMGCWKQNTFSDTACSKEIQIFFDCVTKTEADKSLELIRMHKQDGFHQNK